MRYVSVEISGSLAAVQRKEVGEAFAGWQGERVSGTQSSEARGVGQSNPESPSVGTSNPEKSPYAVQTRDAADRFGWGETQKQPCFVIALEVLDNLPHDKRRTHRFRRDQRQSGGLPRSSHPLRSA